MRVEFWGALVAPALIILLIGFFAGVLLSSWLWFRRLEIGVRRELAGYDRGYWQGHREGHRLGYFNGQAAGVIEGERGTWKEAPRVNGKFARRG
jgi:hypothetical protein